jgi:hypothetical protein
LFFKTFIHFKIKLIQVLFDTLSGSEELAYNVFGLAEGGEILAQMFNLVQMFF